MMAVVVGVGELVLSGSGDVELFEEFWDVTEFDFERCGAVVAQCEAGCWCCAFPAGVVCSPQRFGAP